MAIKQAAVIGAGVMGAGIAAQLANAGVPVLLLDIVPEGAPRGTDDRSALARGAIAKMLKADTAHFMWQRAAGLVTPVMLELGRAAGRERAWQIRSRRVGGG